MNASRVSKEITKASDPKTTPFLKPVSTVSQVISSEHVNIVQLAEYYKIAENALLEYEKNIQLLTFKNDEKTKLKDEYLNNRKINLASSKSLLLAKTELRHYRCDLKSEYLAAERKVKFMKIKYQKIVSSYESKWKETLKQYMSDSIVKELQHLEEGNKNLEEEIKKTEMRNNFDMDEFVKFEQNIQNKFLEAVLTFSKEMVSYKMYLNLEGKIRKMKGVLHEQKSPKAIKLHYSRRNIPVFDINSAQNGVVNGNSSSPTFPDITHFDNIKLPETNVDIINEEELLPFWVENPEPSVEKKEEKSQHKNSDVETGNGEVFQDKVNTKPKTGLPENLDKSNMSRTEESESQYFPPDVMKSLKKKETVECWSRNNEKHARSEGEVYDGNTKRLKTNVEEKGNEKDFSRGKQSAGDSFRIDEDSLSEKSFENQYDFPIGNKTSDKPMMIGDYEDNFDNNINNISVSSDGLPASPEENLSQGLPDSQSSYVLPKSDQNKDSFNAFTGFFTMGKDQHSQRPSIFKLF